MFPLKNNSQNFQNSERRSHHGKDQLLRLKRHLTSKAHNKRIERKQIKPRPVAWANKTIERIYFETFEENWNTYGDDPGYWMF